jgi:hypothetical protein
VLLATLVLVSVDGEHDGLKKGIDFGHGDQSAEVSDVAGFGLQEEEKVAVLLSSLVVREEPFLGVCGVIEVAGDFVLLQRQGLTRALVDF